MSYTISQVKSDLTSKLHGTTLSKVQGISDYSIINEAARDFLLDLDPQETIRITQISNGIYDDVYDYSAPTDLKGNKIVDLRPQVNREQSDNFSQAFAEQFGLRKLVQDNMVSIKYNSGTKSLRIQKNLSEGTTLESINGYDTNGEWSVGGDATNITTDTEQYISGAGSINFDLDGSGTTGYVENSTLTSVDLEDDEDISAIFAWLYIPDADIFTSLALRWGSSSSAYWSDSATTTHDGNSPLDGWNLFRFDWNGARETGSPDSSAVDYLRATITYDGTADTDFRLDKIVSRQGTIFEIEYYSKYLFSNSSGTFQEEASADSDYLNLDTDSYNIFLKKLAILTIQNTAGLGRRFDLGELKEDYQTDVYQYQKQYPSQIIKPRQNYYRKGRRRGGNIPILS